MHKRRKTARVYSERVQHRMKRWMWPIAALAACLVLSVGAYYALNGSLWNIPDSTQQPTPTMSAEPTNVAESPTEAPAPTPSTAPSFTSKPTDAATETPKQTAAVMANPMAESPTAYAEQLPTADPAGAIANAAATAALTGTPAASPSPTPEPLPLTGVKVGIDPGHQAHANRDQEAISPSGKDTKDKVSSGTAGVKTRVAEYVVNLDISFMLRDALQALGAEVYMTRESHDVDISNIERAQMMNELGVDIVLRIHCNGNNDRSVNGIGLYIRKTGTGADECKRAAEALLPAMVEATGADATGIHKSDTYTGLNWSEVPSILVEMGYMSNPEEDVLLNDPEYQGKLVAGMAEGIARFMGRDLSNPEPTSTAAPSAEVGE